MCSFWNTMEHDDGDLEAVVRAGRGYNSFASGRNSSYNWQLKGVQGFDPGSVFRSLQVPAELGDSGCNTNNNNNSMASVPAVMGHMNSSVMFPSLLRTAPPAMDLQDLVCSPFYGANVLRSASSSSSLFDSLDQVQAASSPIFGADSQTSLFSTERRSSDQSTQSAAAPVSAVGACKESEDDFGVDMSPTNNLPSQPAAAAVAYVASDHQSGSSDLGSKPIKAEPITTDMSFHKEGDANSSFSQLKTDSGVENGSTQTGSNSTKNQGGSKRRKTQQKRIVCVPAAGGGNRPSGEGLPSDLWAWRKYGQKPIKGSPYPRGYYRCSSSKGCSARKQVERSRTDPSMMVITYTSDHNHPWPTHRNALAGSTRQTTSAEKMAASTDSPNNDQSSAGLNAASADENSDMVENPGGETNPFYSIMDSPEVAAEAQAVGSSPMDQTESFAITAGDGQAGINLFRCVETRHEDDFFAELGELPESLNVFARHFDDDKSDEEAACTHVVDPFNLFNWSSSTFVDTKTAM